MNYKKIASFLILPTIAIALNVEKKEIAKPLRYNSKSQQEKFLSQIKQGYIGLPGGMKLFLNGAQAAGDASCDQIITDAWALCDTMWLDASSGGYDHGALKYFNNSLCWVNNGATADAENVLCHFARSMDISPDLDALPVSITKTFNSLSINVTVSVPNEAFAVSEGYEAKGVVTVDSNPYMTIYWGGSGASSKGFLIEGDTDGLGGDRAGYTSWDLTDATAETVQLLKAEFPSGSYLNSVAAGDRGDNTVYGKVVFNSTTNAVVTQMVLIADKRGAQAGTGFGCFKMYANGTKGGSMVIAKTRDEVGGDQFNSHGHSTASTVLNLTDMDGVELIDDPATVNGTGNLGGNNAADMQANVEAELAIAAGANVFDKSCADLNDAGSGGGVFNQGAYKVSFSYGPSDVF